MNILNRLHKCIQTGVRASDLDLGGAALSGARLSHLKGDRLDLRAADLREATLCDTRLGGCRLQDARLEHSDWSRATLRTCILDGAHAADGRFDAARIEDSTAVGADLSRASLRGAHLTETSFARAVMREAVLDDAEGEGVEFRGADLAGATLAGARLDEADFRGADLRGADLSRGRFRSADFRGALLDSARFDGADCAGARFDREASHTTKNAASRFDRAALDTLRDVVSALPNVLAARDGPAAEVFDGVRRAVETLAADPASSGEEWKRWLERLTQLIAAEEPAEPRALFEALSNGPAGAADLLVPLRHIADTLTEASDQPPEEWKPVLDSLMKMKNEGRPLDQKALLDALSLLIERPVSDR